MSRSYESTWRPLNKTITLRISEEMLEEIKRKQAIYQSTGDFIRDALKEYLQRY